MITSSEISNLISAQIAAASQLQAFTGGLTPGTDPSQPKMSIGSQVGMAATQAAIGIAQAAPFVAAGASMMGMLPNAFDPFSGTLGAVSAGWKLGGGASSFAKAGASAIGMGMTALGGYMAAGAALNAATDNLMRGAQEQLQVNMMMSYQATRYNLPLMGGMGTDQQRQMGGFVRGMSSGMGLPVSDVTGFIGQGLESGMFRSARNMGQFQSQVSGLSGTLSMLKENMGMGVQGGMGAIQQMQDMGFQGHAQAANAFMAYQGMSRGLGISSGALMGAGSYGGMVASSMGVNKSLGTRVATGLATRIGTANMLGGISNSSILEMGLGNTVEDSLPMLSGQLTQSALGMVMGNTSAMAALLDPETGELDAGQVAMFRSGTLSSKAMQKLGRKNLQNKGVRSAIGARSGSIASSLMEQIGPEGILGGFAQAEMLSRGVKKGENSEDVMDMLLQQYTGLGEQQANMVQTLINDPSIRTESNRILKDELGRMSQAAKFSNNYSVEAIKKKLIDATVGPILKSFRDAGAGIANWGSELVDSGVNYMFGENKMLKDSERSSEYGRQSLRTAMATGTSLNLGGGGGGGGYSFGSDLVGGPQGAVMSYTGLQGGYSGAMSGIGVGAAMAGNLAGRAFSPGLSIARHGLKEMALIGGIASGARSVAGGVAMTALGAAGKFALGPAGMLAAGYDLAFNIAPAAAKGLGLTEDDSGYLDPGVSSALMHEFRGGQLHDVNMQNIGGMSSKGMGYLGNAADLVGRFIPAGDDPTSETPEFSAYREAMAGRGYGGVSRGFVGLSGTDGTMQVERESLGKYVMDMKRAVANPSSFMKEGEMRRIREDVSANRAAFWDKEAPVRAKGGGFERAPGYEDRVREKFTSLAGKYGADLAAGMRAGELQLTKEKTAIAGADVTSTYGSAESYKEAAMSFLKEGTSQYPDVVAWVRQDRMVHKSDEELKAAYTSLEGAFTDDKSNLGGFLRKMVTGKSDDVRKLRAFLFERVAQTNVTDAEKNAFAFLTHGKGGGLALRGFAQNLNAAHKKVALDEAMGPWTAKRDALQYEAPGVKSSLRALIGTSADSVASGMKGYYNEAIGGGVFGKPGDFAKSSEHMSDMVSSFLSPTNSAEERAEASDMMEAYGDDVGAGVTRTASRFYDAGAGKEKKRGDGLLSTLSMLPGARAYLTGDFVKNFRKGMKSGKLTDDAYSDIDRLIKGAIPDVTGLDDDKARDSILEKVKSRAESGKDGIASAQKVLAEELTRASGMFRKGGSAAGGNQDALGNFAAKLAELLPELNNIVNQAGQIIKPS